MSQKPQLFYQVWHPNPAAHGIVLIAHGLGGHSGQFTEPAKVWAAANLAVYAIDFRGHGRSEGARGYISCWDNYLQDLYQLRDQILTRYPSLPVILWGHSLGGLIALDFAFHYPDALSGLILTAPAVGQTGVSPFMFALGRLLSWVWPRFSLEVGFDSRASSRNPEVVKRYNADPLHHCLGTARLSTEFQQAQVRLSESAAHIQTPTLILHGGGDRITNPKDSVRLYQTMTVRDRKLIQYPHAYHELHLDINQDQVISDMSQWIHAHCISSES